MSKVYFIADLHIGHKNILKYSKGRIDNLSLKDEESIEEHDSKIIELWLNTVKRDDIVYVLGDFILSSKENNKAFKILSKLKSSGCKIHLIVGNHDKSSMPYSNMFESMETIKEVTFKKSIFPFLNEDLQVVMCHFPLMSWNRKSYGVAHLHGHTHNTAPWENENGELRLNVGFDTPFANFNLVSLEQVYDWYLKKLNGLTPIQYIENETKKNHYFIR